MTPALSRRRVLGGIAALPAAALLTAGPSAAAASSLKAAAQAGHRFFDAAVRFDQIAADDALRAAVLRNCTHLTPEIDLKWNALEPRRGELRLGPADDLAQFALRHGLKLRGHTLLWHDGVPGWAAEALAERPDWTLVRRLFASVIPRFGDSIEDWEVVNEPIETGYRMDGLRRNPFLAAFGPDYIRRALEEARQFAPNARLAINEYGLDYELPVERDRRYLLLRLIERLRNEGAPLNAIGLQAHLDLAKGPFDERAFEAFLKELAGFDLQIAITEFDVMEADRRAPIAVRDRRVADMARRYLDVALAQKAVAGIATWGLSDRHSWLQEHRPEPREGAADANRGLPYDGDFAPKPLHRAIRDALRSAPPRL